MNNEDLLRYADTLMMPLNLIHQTNALDHLPSWGRHVTMDFERVGLEWQLLMAAVLKKEE